MQQQQPAGGGVTFFIEIRLPWRHPIKVQRGKGRVGEQPLGPRGILQRQKGPFSFPCVSFRSLLVRPSNLLPLCSCLALWTSDRIEKSPRENISIEKRILAVRHSVCAADPPQGLKLKLQSRLFSLLNFTRSSYTQDFHGYEATAHGTSVHEPRRAFTDTEWRH